MIETERLLTTQEVAARCRVAPQTVFNWVNKGHLKALRAGRVLRFRPSDVESFLENGNVNATETGVVEVVNPS